MDRNQATGLILIAVMVLLYFYFFSPKPQPVEETATTNTENQVTEEPDSTYEAVTPEKDSARNALNQQKYGVFAEATSGTKESSVLENDMVKINFSNQGGVINGVELKNFKTYKNEPVILINSERNKFALLLNSMGQQVDLNKLYYSPSKSTVGDTTVLTYTLQIGSGNIKQIYKLPKNGYQLAYHLEMNGLDQYISDETLVYQWQDHIKTQEKDVSMSRRNSTINYYTLGEGGFDGLSQRSSKTEEEAVEKSLQWVSIKQRFFVSGFIARKSFTKGKFTASVDESDSSTVKFAKIVLGIPAGDVKSGGADYTYYFGPNDYHITSKVAPDFENNLYLGWPPMKWINEWVIIPLFNLLSRFIGNYGVIIILMVLLIKLVLSPLSYKSYLSMAKMKVLKPELDEIKEKHGGDMTKAQQEQMKLYQKVGVSPLSGCIPMLLQMPILFSMFYFFPQSIELRGESFLWADDLSTYDSIFSWSSHIPIISTFYGNHVSLFVLLMTMSTILYTWSNQQVSTAQGPMKTFSYIMPVIFMFVLNSYPAALSFYYFVSNLVTFGQQAAIRKFVDEDKIRAILEENRKRNVNKKKSKFQLKLEEAMKAGNQTKNKK